MKKKYVFCLFLVVILCFSSLFSCSGGDTENGHEQEDVEENGEIEDIEEGAEESRESEEEEVIDKDDNSEGIEEIEEIEESGSGHEQEEGPVISDDELIQRVKEIENLETQLFDEKNIITESDYDIKHKTIQDREQLRKFFQQGYSSEVAEMMAYYYMDDEGYLIPGESTKVVEYAEEVEVVENKADSARIRAVVEMFGITNTYYINLRNIEGTWKIVD